MSAVLSIQLMLVVALPLIVLVSRRLPPVAAVRISRLLLVGAILLPLVLPALSITPAWRPPAQVFAEPGGPAVITLSAAPVSATVPAAARSGSRMLVAVAIGLGLLWTVLSVRGLLLLLAGTRLVRRIGRVEVRAGAPACMALSLPGRSIVLLDDATFADPTDRLIAVRHELQHHRQGDPRFAWLLQALVVTCCLNPAAWLIRRQLMALDELACDDHLRRQIPVRDYCDALLRAARRPASLPALTPGLTRSTLLHRRIQMLTRPPRSTAVLPLAVLSFATLLTAAHAAEGLLTDGTIDADELAVLAQRVESIEVTAEPVLLAALNGQLSNPRTRAFLRSGLENRPEYAELVSAALSQYDLPEALAAVPLIESGYENLGVGQSGYSLAPGIPGKGVWMFIPQTARNYGLDVSTEVDERLDPVAETDAAMRLLSDLHVRFGDWGLALAGYNQGAGHVAGAIEAEGTDDVWALVEAGALNGYVPQVYAAMVLMESPELVE
ncbi:MAG: membrane-bound lytic murein transglycosylase D [Myxococcota bacterium]